LKQQNMQSFGATVKHVDVTESGKNTFLPRRPQLTTLTQVHESKCFAATSGARPAAPPRGGRRGPNASR